MESNSPVSARPARHLAVLTCMDCRFDPLDPLDLNLGDAHVIRNAGGRASDDALRSLIISSHLLGTTQYYVIHHTECGMLGLDNDELRQHLADETGADASSLDLLGYDDLEASVRDDMARIEENPFVPTSVTVRGFIYDVLTGTLSDVPLEK